MSTYSNKPNFIVNVNGIKSACNGDCTYTFLTSVPNVTASDITSINKLGLTIAVPTGMTLALTDLTITLDGKACITPTGTLASFTCQLPINTDNSPIISAGSHFPVVIAKNIGTLGIDSAVTPINVTFSFTNATAATGANNGGYTISVNGKGFPSSIDKISKTPPKLTSVSLT